MSTARISVVVPTRNRCAACERAVASALDQTFQPLEVLVCDDGSTDGTGARFETWARRDSRIKYRWLAGSGGVPARPRNAGIEAARGEWIAFLDDDDVWLPEKLALQAPFLGRFDVVAGNAVRSDGVLYFPSLQSPAKPDRFGLLRDNPIVNSTAVVRRSLLDDVGRIRSDPRLRGIEDYCLWLDLADRRARFVVLPEPTVRYESAGDDRLSSAATRRQWELALHLLQRWRARPRDAALAAGAAVHVTRSIKLATRRGLSPRRAR